MSPDATLRVVTLNAASLLEPGWDERRHETLAWLDHLDADIVCLQEVWRDGAGHDTAAWLVDHTPPGRWHWVFGGVPFPRALWDDPSLLFGSAILSRWPIDEHHLDALPADDHHPDPMHRLGFELLHARTNGIDVFSTHLAPPTDQAYQRVHQVRFIDQRIKALRDPDAALPPILCGDFNAEPDSDEIRFLGALATIEGRSTFYQEAWRATAQTDPGFTWDGRTNPIAATMHLPPQRIDYVFVGDPFGRPDGAGLIVHAELAFHRPLTGVLASDHYGVLAELRWPQREG